MESRPLRLPEKQISEQKQSKASWNQAHPAPDPDFYTIGYSGRDLEGFIAVLKQAGVVTLVDIRHTPLSRFRPDFSKNKLKQAVEASGINYVHRSDWGVPKEVRSISIGRGNRDDIWDWYDAHVLPDVAKRNLDEFFNSMEHPIALMCVEYDPAECHRHRIFLGLERLGLRGRELP